MPRTTLPPTPVSSTDIIGKDGSQLPANETSFNLPPPAIPSNRVNGNPSADNHTRPTTSPNFSLPPPPTRSRTIIQMKPKSQQAEGNARSSATQTLKGSGRKSAPGSGANAGGKKLPSSTSVAGKKIARKTAHSVIERRRRSKMNEEFGVLKAMIPACTDQEMHKLAILQASIDYLRYLENCISDLKAANKSLSTPPMQPQAPTSRSNTGMAEANERLDEEEHNGDEDISMEDSASTNTTPALLAKQAEALAYTSPQSTAASPAFDSLHRYTSSSYASSLSTLPSPAFGPQHYRPQSHHSQNSYTAPLSASTSPTIMPSKEQDCEATAALLMLNQDRRNPKNNSKGGRGMSVKDLLSC